MRRQNAASTTRRRTPTTIRSQRSHPAEPAEQPADEPPRPAGSLVVPASAAGPSEIDVEEGVTMHTPWRYAPEPPNPGPVPPEPPPEPRPSPPGVPGPPDPNPI